MNQDQFVLQHQSDWKELAAILQVMERQGARRLPLAKVERMGRLYRQAASDLAYARTYYPRSDVVQYLNQLVARAHSSIYAPEPQRLRTLWAFFRDAVPQAVRESWRPIVLAFGFMLLGGLIGFFAVLYDPGLAHALIPASILQHVVTPEQRFNMATQMRPAIGTLIMLNNIFVGVRAFALGITLGVGTAIELFRNGLMIGAVAAQSVPGGESFALWAFLLAHGTLELMAIFLCGGAGFVVGWAIIAPGELPRKEAIARAGHKAVLLVINAVLFFAIAASIEGLVTPMISLPPIGKYGVAALTGALALTYWLRAGRSNRSRAGHAL